MKKTFLILFLALALAGCETATTTRDPGSPCRDTPLAEGCYATSWAIDFEPAETAEFTIAETFDAERLNQQPGAWLLYTDAEYAPGGVYARVVGGETERYVEMYSDGLRKPPYPQSAPTPTFIFTTKFNLDLDRKGVAEAAVMIPATGGNALAFGVATGAVNAISVLVGNDLGLTVKVGGPFYYHSQTGDGGSYHATGITIAAATWVRFRFEWDAAADRVAAYLLDGDAATLLYEGGFHVSNRVNAEAEGAILVPDVFKVTMPYGQSGRTFLDDVIVYRKGD